MVAKGLNIPNVTLVGVLDADLSLYADSYRSAETTLNMITQVVGRAGRGEQEGQAMIQTMVPDHQVLKMAARQDYDSFYDMEISLRELQRVPPFGDLTQVKFIGMDEGAVLRGAVKFRDSLSACLKDPAYQEETCTVLGPAPCPVPKINYNLRYRITLRCRMDRTKRLLLAHLLRQFSLDKENRGISVFADVSGFD
jgi:primosomal protein N' (replication factor Y)